MLAKKKQVFYTFQTEIEACFSSSLVLKIQLHVMVVLCNFSIIKFHIAQEKSK
jgi:hypothetical protein